MTARITRRGLIAVAAVVTAIGFGTVPMSAAPGGMKAAADRNSDSTSTTSGVDSGSALVLLNGEPLSTNPRTKPAPGKKVDFSSETTKAERARLSALRNDFKAWLRQNAPAVKVSGEYDLALNAVAVRLNGTSLDSLRGAPQVVAAEYQLSYQPHDDADPDLNLINAIDAWRSGQVGGAAEAGRGIKVGVIDTGIDHTHPCFDDAGYPATTQLGDRRFTNNKVIVAKVFHNKTPSQGYTPEALQDHGTHVAGTVACNLDTDADVLGAPIPYGVSGVAPAAQLGNYNVFPGSDGNARSEDILNAMEAAYFDGMDVINMSLGGPSSGARDLLTIGVDNLDQANMVNAISAGNEGPGHYTVGSPGSAARALTAGAATVGHFVGAPVAVQNGPAFQAASGDFAVVASNLTAPLGVVTSSPTTLGLACSALPAGSLAGKIAVVSRGSCSFSIKIQNAQNAGALATLVVNNVAGDPNAMGFDTTLATQPTIPAYALGKAATADVIAANGRTATISASLSYFRTANDNIMAGFSSQGPTDTSFRRVKPDVVAPGVNVLSSVPVSFCGAAATDCWAFFQGTSMAAPHLAGMAAVVRGVHPTWTAEQVRSAIVNTATEGVLKNWSNGTTVETDVNVVGAGMGNLVNALNAKVAIGPVSTAFGSVPSGSNQSRTEAVRLTNLTGSAMTVTLSVDSVVGSGVAFSPGTSTVTLPAGGSVNVPVTAAVDRGAPAGDHSAMLRLSAGGVQIAHSVLYVFVV